MITQKQRNRISTESKAHNQGNNRNKEKRENTEKRRSGKRTPAPHNACDLL